MPDGEVQDLGVDLEALLFAARVEFPDKAAQTSEVASLLSMQTQRLNVESALAGEPKILTDALQFCGDVYLGLRTLVDALNYCSTGLIAMVDTYRGSDEEAAAAFNLVDATLTQGDPALATVPPDIGNPAETGDMGVVVATEEARDPEEVLDELNSEIERPDFPEVPS